MKRCVCHCCFRTVDCVDGQLEAHRCSPPDSYLGNKSAMCYGSGAFALEHLKLPDPEYTEYCI